MMRTARAFGRLAVSVTLAFGAAGCPAGEEKAAESLQDRLRDRLTAPDFVASYGPGNLEAGDPFARLIVAELRVDVIVVEGTTGNALQSGAGHYTNSPFPGEVGNVAIAGHRTSFGAPFRMLDRLTEGSEVVLVTPKGRFVYAVAPPFEGHANPWVTTPRDFSVISPTAGRSLTLTTTHPPESALERLIVRLRLKTSEAPSN
jgi:sortase A